MKCWKGSKTIHSYYVPSNNSTVEVRKREKMDRKTPRGGAGSEHLQRE